MNKNDYKDICIVGGLKDHPLSSGRSLSTGRNGVENKAFHVQLFITTHSIEAIDGLLVQECFPDARYMRIEKHSDSRCAYE